MRLSADGCETTTNNVKKVAGESWMYIWMALQLPGACVRPACVRSPRVRAFAPRRPRPSLTLSALYSSDRFPAILGGQYVDIDHECTHPRALRPSLVFCVSTRGRPARRPVQPPPLLTHPPSARIPAVSGIRLHRRRQVGCPPRGHVVFRGGCQTRTRDVRFR